MDDYGRVTPCGVWHDIVRDSCGRERSRCGRVALMERGGWRDRTSEYPFGRDCGHCYNARRREKEAER